MKSRTALGDGRGPVSRSKSHGSPANSARKSGSAIRDAPERHLCLAKGFWPARAFRAEKPGETEIFEAQWARSRPVSFSHAGLHAEPGHESGCPTPYSRPWPPGRRDARAP